jgi:hypothetical protein
MTSTPFDGQPPVDPRPELAIVPSADQATTSNPSSEPTPAAVPAQSLEGKQFRRAHKRAEVARRRKTARHTRSVFTALRGGRLSRRAAVRSLKLEQELHGAQRAADTSTHGEALVHSVGKSGGDLALGRTQRRLNKQAAARDALQARQQSLTVQADHRPHDLVDHPDGGVRTAADTQADQADQRAEIAAEEEQGSRKHRRLPRGLRLVPKLVLFFDAVLLLYFFAGVTNVDWARPLAAALVFALMLACAVTGISYGFFTLAGGMLNSHKAEDGTLGLDELDPVTKAVLALAGLGVMVLALLMFVRMRAEVLQALGTDHGGAALVIALTLAMVSVLANTMVVVVHALDGSEATARLDGLGKAVRGPVSKEHQLRERAAGLNPQIEAADREAQRTAATGITQAGRQLAAADQIVDAARSLHQGVGMFSEPATDPNTVGGVIGYRSPAVHPQVDERPVRLALKHLAQATGSPEATDRPQPAGRPAVDASSAATGEPDPTTPVSFEKDQGEAA